jgi:hypothetical protein
MEGMGRARDWFRLWIHGTTVRIDPAHRDRFEAEGLASFDALAGAARSSGAGRDQRSVSRLAFAGGAPKAYYLKRYAYGGPRILRTFLYRAKAQREYANLRRVIEAGVPAVRPVAWGVRRRFGFVRDSVLVTESIDGAQNARTLIGSYLAGRFAAVPREAFRDAMGRLVDDLRRLHDQGLYLQTAFEKNVLVWMREGRAAYAWVDLPFAGRTPPGWLPRRLRIRDLACLNKGLEAALSAPERLRLLIRYLGPQASWTRTALFAARVVHRTRALRDETPGARLVKWLKRACACRSS